MKLLFALLLSTLASATFAADPSSSSSHLRKDEAALERSRGRGRRDHEGKHGQAMISVHGMSNHPTAADVAIIDQAVVAAFNNIHPHSKEKLAEFHDTWVQVFKEEADEDEDGPFLADKKGDNKIDRTIVYQNLDGYWWGGFGGWCWYAPFDDDDDVRLADASSPSVASELLQEMLGSSAVGDELCKLLLKSGAAIFRDVYGCAVSTKPAELAVIDSLRQKKAGSLDMIATAE